MFENVAPVLPETALRVLERAGNSPANVATRVWRQHVSLLRSLAYDVLLFTRSGHLLARAATHTTDAQEAKSASETFSSLFTIYFSGTHATIEQRLQMIDRLLRSRETQVRTLGVAALGEVLKTRFFSANHRFEFGARSRDYGYQPRSRDDVTHWYGAALTMIERVALTEGLLKPELRDLVAQHFRGLWTWAHMYNDLERLARRFAADGFWRAGWFACRMTLQFDRDGLTPESAARLAALEVALQPVNLREQVLAVVKNIEYDGVSASERPLAMAYDLGGAVATQDDVFAELVPDLLLGGSRAWEFGCGLANTSPDRRATWTRLVEGLAQIAPEQRNVQVLRGFLAELWKRDRDLAHHLLDEAVEHPDLGVFLPVLQSAVELDADGVNRLKRSLSKGQAPIWMYRNVAYGRTADHLPTAALKNLVLHIADQTDGFDVAVDILSAHLDGDRAAQQSREPELLEVGQELLRRVTFGRSNQSSDYELAGVVRASLSGPSADRIAAEVTLRLKQAVADYETSAFQNADLLRALFELQPVAVLDALFSGADHDYRVAFNIFGAFGNHHNPMDAISAEDLVAWCERDGAQRYPLVAMFIPFVRRPDECGPQVWSEHAKALLARAPDPRMVLEVFIERFRPMTWSDSQAARIEANAQLLDSLEEQVLADLMPFVTEAKARLSQEIAQMRQQETHEDRVRDERFE